MSDIIRRDPRAEWIARNRLHPLHASMQKAENSWMGPNGIIRKNPHAIAAGFIGPAGLKRIDRSGAQQGTSGVWQSVSDPCVGWLPLLIFRLFLLPFLPFLLMLDPTPPSKKQR